MKRALLVLNGEPPSKALVRRLAGRANLVVAADGGSNVLHRYGITPDAVVGDLDSVLPSTKRRFSSARFVHVPDPNRTDFEKALRFLVQERADRVWVVGMTGRRIDFTLGNFVSIWKFVPRLDLTFFGEDWMAFPVKGNLRLSVPVGSTVSLIPYGRCQDVTLKGFRYPLRKATMNAVSLGISNVTTAAHSSILLRKGRLLAVVLGPPRIL